MSGRYEKRGGCQANPPNNFNDAYCTAKQVEQAILQIGAEYGWRGDVFANVAPVGSLEVQINVVAMYKAMPSQLKQAAPHLAKRMIRAFVATMTPIDDDAMPAAVQDERRESAATMGSLPLQRAWKSAAQDGRRERRRGR